jgi:hypothetical protein
MGDGCVAAVVEHPSNKHKALNSNPSTTKITIIRKWSVMLLVLSQRSPQASSISLPRACEKCTLMPPRPGRSHFTSLVILTPFSYKTTRVTPQYLNPDLPDAGLLVYLLPLTANLLVFNWVKQCYWGGTICLLELNIPCPPPTWRARWGQSLRGMDLW